MKYIQFGEKKNGRFVKSEQYSLTEFFRIMEENKMFIMPKKMNWLERLFGKQRRLNRELSIYYEAQNDYILDLFSKINFLIDSDKKGKKNKK